MRGVPEQPSGLVLREDFVSPAEEAELVGHCAGLELRPLVMHGVESRRRVCHFGMGYDVGVRSEIPVDPIPGWLLEVRRRGAELAGAEPDSFVEALVTEYAEGATIGWHRDAPVFGPVVVGVSLGSDAVMRFQRRAVGGERRVHEQDLPRRSAYVLAGAARWAWQHSIPPVKDLRWSVTFRQLRE